MFLAILLMFFIPSLHAEGGDLLRRGDRTWPITQEDLTATLRPGTSVYQLPEQTGDRNLSRMPWNYWRERCQWTQDQLKGKLLYQNDEVAAVRLDRDPGFCGSYFNDGQEDRRVVFVKKSDLENVVPRGEEVIEAGVNFGCTGDCEGDHALQALRAMAREAARAKPGKGCQKTEAELERYLDCHATEHQDNYNKHYKKLFNLAGQTFQAAYRPGRGVEAILRPEDSQRGSVPFLIGAKANVMKCIGLRETRWDPLRVSHTGAMGLGQQTAPNVEHIRCLLKGVCPEKKNGKKVLVQRAPTAWAVTLWNEFFRRVKAELPLGEQAELFTHPRTGERCGETMEVKERDAPCPINSIAAMALYQMEAELIIRKTSPLYKDSPTGDFNQEERCNLEIVQGATNNAGTGTVRGAVRAGVRPENWRAQLRHNTPIPGHDKETDQFSKYIQNCLQEGNMDSMHPPAPGKKASDCSRYSKRAR